VSELLPRTRAFALRCLKVADAMPAKAGSRVIASQLARSATSVAANYRAARRGRSKAEFLSKLQIALEEADESHFWLGLAIDGGYLPAKQLDPLVCEADELTAMLVSSLKTARRSGK
jgi:four helix bundle protein